MEDIMRMRLTEELWREGNMYVAYCPELDIPSCGETVEQAKSNLKEVLLIFLMETAKMGTLDKLLQDAGFDQMQETLCVKKELVGFTPIEVVV
jgi:predicted RNase H-like HicB family nuclease